MGVAGGVVVVDLDEAVYGVFFGEGGEVAEEGVALVAMLRRRRRAPARRPAMEFVYMLSVSCVKALG